MLFVDTDAVNFLGISIVGQMSKTGDAGGIYVGSIMKGWVNTTMYCRFSFGMLRQYMVSIGVCNFTGVQWLVTDV